MSSTRWSAGQRGSYAANIADLRTTQVATMLTPDERLRVDALGLGWMEAHHRESVDDLMRDLRHHRARALIVSTAMCQRTSVSSMARMVREFPRVPAVALLSQLDRSTVRTVLSLGQCGVRTLIDVREPTGWKELRALLLGERTSDVRRVAMSRLSQDLMEAHAGARRFFEVLFDVAPGTVTVRDLCARLGVPPGTMMSRFFRAQLPPPKQYLILARLTFAARLFENPGVSIANVSNQLGYSSPQSFSRHVRGVLKLSALEFRARYDGDGMLECLRERLVLPYRAQWQRFDPMGEVPVLLRKGPLARSGTHAGHATKGSPEMPPEPVASGRVASGGDAGEEL